MHQSLRGFPPGTVFVCPRARGVLIGKRLIVLITGRG